MLAKLVPAQRAGLHASKAGTSPASRPTCSPSWYQPSKQAYLLAKLVPAQRAGAPLDNRFTGHQEECVLLSMTRTDRPSRGVHTPLDDQDGPAIKRRMPPLDGQRSPVIKGRRAPLDDWSARVINRSTLLSVPVIERKEDASSRGLVQSGHQEEACSSG
ncbi:hypothetical protein PCANC_00742 [Puccinia coronata f. sp. avenae]|uniref:Uncharacterized protein n=1 Tax=Puccinia coronata f. sp. avenae TaxID=200324 RepID=A0A2N5W6W6_9BASI|nr:hypothetical protein PCANC_00742 [Puccinia coronata f. sp. avenae]